jgi:hypothetical protein
MRNQPIWAKTLSKFMPDRQVSEITPCFKRPTPVTQNAILSVTFPWDQVHLIVPNQHHTVRNKAAKVLTSAILFAQEFDLNLYDIEGHLVLDKYLYWRNFDTDVFVTASFRALIQFEQTQYEDMPAPLCCDIWWEVAVVGSEKDVNFCTNEKHDSVKSISSLKAACREFDSALKKSLSRKSINAPFCHMSDLPRIQGVSDQDVFEVTYFDRDKNQKSDQICFLRRSIYSMPERLNLKWIYAYSRDAHSYIDIKLENVTAFKRRGVNSTAYTGKNGSQSIAASVKFPWG